MKNIIDNIRFIIKWIPNKLGLVGLILGLLSLSSFSYIQPKLLGKSVDFIVEQDSEKFYKITLLILILYFIKYTLSVIIKNKFIEFSQDMNERLRLGLLSKAIDAEMSYYDKHEKGYVQSRIDEAGLISMIFSPNTLTVILGGLELIISAISMVLLDIRMSAILFLIIPFYFIIINKHTKRLTEHSKMAMETGAIVSANVFSIINEIEQIKVTNDDERRIKLYKERFKNLKNTLILQGKSTVVYFEKTQLISAVASTLVLAISGYKIFSKQFTLGEYTTFAAYSNRFFSSILSIASIGITLTPLLVGIERIKEFFNTKNENEGRSLVLDEKINSIDISNLSFSYKEDFSNKILKNINMNWKIKDKVWIQGVNGSGKTTLIKILIGLYPVSMGRILINGISINSINLKSLRSNYAIMLQNSTVFSGKIIDNILLEKSEEKERKLQEIVEKYDLKLYFDNFEDEFDSQMSESGNNISSGQNQLILFLRTVLSNKPVLILDEPTSNMDKKLKPKILKILDEYASNKLVILVSHDKSIEKDINELGFIKEEIIDGYSKH